MIFAPTDAAFAQLPKATLNEYLSDPNAAARLVKNLTAAGYFPRASLSATGDTADTFGRTVTNLLGKPLVLSGFLNRLGQSLNSVQITA